jgi:hypothetical protein
MSNLGFIVMMNIVIGTQGEQILCMASNLKNGLCGHNDILIRIGFTVLIVPFILAFSFGNGKSGKYLGIG